jgi:hypothetical protein
VIVKRLAALTLAAVAPITSTVSGYWIPAIYDLNPIIRSAVSCDFTRLWCMWMERLTSFRCLFLQVKPLMPHRSLDIE